MVIESCSCEIDSVEMNLFIRTFITGSIRIWKFFFIEMLFGLSSLFYCNLCNLDSSFIHIIKRINKIFVFNQMCVNYPFISISILDYTIVSYISRHGFHYISLATLLSIKGADLRSLEKE